MSHENSVAADQLQWLIDIEAIKQLKARYCTACDQDYQAGQLAEMFTEDAVWDGGMMGYAKGREGIRKFFANASNVVGFAVHGVSNPLIEIDGDEATGAWYLFQPMVLKGSDACYWFCARYADKYLRTSDGWKFQHVKVEARAFTPYEQGFGNELLAALPS